MNGISLVKKGSPSFMNKKQSRKINTAHGTQQNIGQWLVQSNTSKYILSGAMLSGALYPAVITRSSRSRALSTRNELFPPGRRVTHTMLLINGVVYLADFLLKSSLFMWGCKLNNQIAAGQLWRLITPVFLHGGLVHLAVNSYSLLNIGPAYESIAGSKRFLGVYLASGFVGTFVSYRMVPHPSVGASGAIFGVVGALTAFFLQHQDALGRFGQRQSQQLITMVALNTALGFGAKSMVDNWAHMGGLVGGVITQLLMGPRYVMLNTPGGRRMVDMPLLKEVSWRLQGKL